jgi:tetraacyldisaccharide 4'-kinase
MLRQLLILLTPVYRLGLAARELRLRRSWEQVRRLRYPVISVGNLSTGGAGKTPFAITLARALTARGFGVDVLSRGYGRKTVGTTRVDPNGSAEEFGDEPLLIAKEGQVPVYVGQERYEAGVLAERSRDLSAGAGGPVRPGVEARPKPFPFKAAELAMGGGLDTKFADQTRVHILDDGFQHRQLHRDVNLLLLNREDYHDRLLPAGNLREPLSAMRRADVVVIPEADSGLETELRSQGWKGPVWRTHRRMEVPQVEGSVLAFCGIARPEQFFAGLEGAGLRLADRITFRDHHRYSNRDLDRLRAGARSAGARALMTTAKDEVRLAQLAGTREGDLPLLTARLTIEIRDCEAALDWLTSRLCATEFGPSV